MSKHKQRKRAAPEFEIANASAAEAEALRLSRRAFMSFVSASGVTASFGARAATSAEPEAVAASGAEQASLAPEVSAASGYPIRLTVNGKVHEAKVDPRTSLLDYLRESAQLTGTKKGCDHGQCGACTVHVNGRRVNSCLSLAVMHDGDTVTTIEGLGRPGKLHPMQAAFVEHDGYQCGYCTAGQIMSAVAFLNEPWGKSDAQVKEAMSGNICRCGAYSNIVAAIQSVRSA